MDWIGHHNDIAHLGIGMDGGGPTRVEAFGWTFPETDVYDTPHHYGIRCDYPGGMTTTISDRNAMGTKWIGDEGWVYVRRGKLQASNKEWLARDFVPGPIRVNRSSNHAGNFIDCVQSRHTCTAPAETGHRSITPGHLGYVSHALQRPIRWDPAGERVVGDDEADRLLNSIDYRAPWSLSS